jgi:hypothetical protein
MSTGTMNPVNQTPANDPWSMEVGGGGGGGDYVLCPPCNGPGTIIGIFDIGTQVMPPDQSGKVKELRKLVLVFELSKKRPDGEPFVLAERYTWSMNEKSNFFALVTNVTGKKYQEGERFNPLSLLSQPVMVSVTNSPAKDKMYHNIGSVAQFPEGFPQPDPVHHPISWSVMTGEAFPAGLDYLPFVYGKSIESLVKESNEAKRRSPSDIPPSKNPDTPF